MNMVDDFEKELIKLAEASDATVNVYTDGISAGFQTIRSDDDLKFSNDNNDLGTPITINTTLGQRDSDESIKMTYAILNESFFSEETWKTMNISGREIRFAVKTMVVSFSLITDSTDHLDVNITFSIPHKEDDHVRVCMFWDISKVTWSGEGCQMVNSDSETETTCFCTHNSSYSVLFLADDNEMSSLSDDHALTLSLLSQLLLILSTVALISGIIILFSLRGLMKCVRTSIHKHLMFTLALSHIVFLTGMDKTTNSTVCSGIAAIMLYTLLSAFMWMLAEAVFLYYKIFDIHKTSLHYTQMSRYFVVCYGVPALVVSVALASNSSGFGTDYSCWLSASNGFIWTFIGPVILICSVSTGILRQPIRTTQVNLVVILKVAKTIYSRSKGHCIKDQKEEIVKTKKAIKGSLLLVPILGVTWLLGLLLVNGASEALSYIFVVFNASQGIAVFLVCVVLSPQVKDELRKKNWLSFLYKDVHPLESETGPQSIQTTTL